MFRTAVTIICVLLLTRTNPAAFFANTTDVTSTSGTDQNATTARTTTTPTTTTANQTYVYLYDKWCAPLASTGPNASAYELLVINAAHTACALYAKALLGFYDLWLLDTFVMNYEISNAQYTAIRTYTINNNLSVPASVTSDLCRAYVSERASDVMMNVLAVVGVPPTSPIASEITTQAPAFCALVWTPFALVSVILSLVVLGRVRKELDKMPSFIVYRGEIVCQLLSFLSFEFFSTDNLGVSFAFLVPFCFISPHVGVNIVQLESTFARTYYAFWLLGAMLKCAVAIERVVLMYFPVFYQLNVTAELVRKIFALFITVYFSLTIVLFVCTYVPMFAGQTVFAPSTSGLLQAKFQIAVFYISALSVVGAVHVICVCLITLKLVRKLAVAASASRQQIINRSIATLVVSTTVVNVATYVWMLCQIVVVECGASCFFGSNSALLAFRTTTIVAGAALLVDMNTAICFVIQCVCSSTYRKAANEAILQPVRSVCKRLLCRSGVVSSAPVIPVGSVAGKTVAKSNARPSGKSSHSRLITSTL